jgi:hypothetical protein
MHTRSGDCVFISFGGSAWPSFIIVIVKKCLSSPFLMLWCFFFFFFEECVDFLLISLLRIPRAVSPSVRITLSRVLVFLKLRNWSLHQVIAFIYHQAFPLALSIGTRSTLAISLDRTLELWTVFSPIWTGGHHHCVPPMLASSQRKAEGLRLQIKRAESSFPRHFPGIIFFFAFHLRKW